MLNKARRVRALLFLVVLMRVSRYLGHWLRGDSLMRRQCALKETADEAAVA